MQKLWLIAAASLLYTLSTTAYSADLEVSLTIDDLPFVGNTHNKPGKIRRENRRFNRIIDTLAQYKIPATGFVVAGSIEKGQWALLEKFRNHGFIIANHTFSHANLNRMSADRYIDNIARADSILQPLYNGPKFFRYPYLAQSRGQRREDVRNYLHQQDYTIAPVTIDTKDFMFNAQLLRVHWRSRKNYIKSTLKRRYLNYIWRQTLRAQKRAQKKMGRPIKHVLLIHTNLLNSHVLGDIIELYQKNGYKFVSLKEALSDPYYQDKALLSDKTNLPPVVE